MKKWATATILLILPLSTSAGEALDLPPEFLKFYYMNAEGDFRLSCTHQRINELTHDWRLRCGDGTSNAKSFDVHFLVRKYNHPGPPKFTYEVLYWVGAPETRKEAPQFTGTSLWLSFNGDASLHSFTLNQSVENDYARIWLEVSPTPQFSARLRPKKQ